MICCGMKDTRSARVGDTWHLAKRPVQRLPGFKPAKSMVFAGRWIFVVKRLFLYSSPCSEMPPDIGRCKSPPGGQTNMPECPHAPLVLALVVLFGLGCDQVGGCQGQVSGVAPTPAVLLPQQFACRCPVMQPGAPVPKPGKLRSCTSPSRRPCRALPTHLPSPAPLPPPCLHPGQRRCVLASSGSIWRVPAPKLHSCMHLRSFSNCCTRPAPAPTAYPRPHCTCACTCACRHLPPQRGGV
jgi:hypothetical protein